MKGQRNVKLNNRGAAMMVAIVIVGILMIFIFSLLLVSYTLYASQSKVPASRRNSEAANSLSQALETEMTRTDAPLDSALWKYVRLNILQESWPYYDPSVDGHGSEAAFRYFNLGYQRINAYKDYLEDSGTEGVLGELSGYPGNVEICMYYELPKGASTTDDPAHLLDKSGTVLTMEIACDTGSQTYVVTNKYLLTQTNDNSRDAKTALLAALTNKEYYNPWNNTVDFTEKWVWEFQSRE
ncbi:MAG: type II secretion system GspH family protein [Lachnospiraceae bacterium]|nr:type II secretion system GspH family protein [Lachnospiraceae bacterium]